MSTLAAKSAAVMPIYPNFDNDTDNSNGEDLAGNGPGLDNANGELEWTSRRQVSSCTNKSRFCCGPIRLCERPGPRNEVRPPR